MIKQEQIAAYREMAKNASENSMEAQIRANLESNCDKFAGNEDKFNRCMVFLKNVCIEMLGGEDAAEGDENRNCKKLSGEIPDEVCFRICRDYFNDEIWKKEDEEEARKKAEAEERARLAAEKKAKAGKGKKAKKAKPEEEKASKCARCGTEVLELEKGLCPACHALLHPAQKPEEEKPASEPEAESIPEQKPAFKPVNGQISFLDMLGA